VCSIVGRVDGDCEGGSVQCIVLSAHDCFHCSSVAVCHFVGDGTAASMDDIAAVVCYNAIQCNTIDLQCKCNAML